MKLNLLSVNQILLLALLAAIISLSYCENNYDSHTERILEDYATQRTTTSTASLKELIRKRPPLRRVASNRNGTRVIGKENVPPRKIFRVKPSNKLVKTEDKHEPSTTTIKSYPSSTSSSTYKSTSVTATTKKPKSSSERKRSQSTKNSYSSASFEQRVKSSNESTMLLIPVPPSQRKAYQPIIIQKTTQKPVTYRLNKLFVPLGIYGKVLRKNTTEGELSKESRESAQQQQSNSGQQQDTKSFNIQDQQSMNKMRSKVKNSIINVRHKGTDSSEHNISMRPSPPDDFMTTGDDSRVSESSVVFSSSSTSPEVSSLYSSTPSNLDNVYLTSQRPNIESVSFTRSPPDSIYAGSEQITGFSEDINNGWQGIMNPPLPMASRPHSAPGHGHGDKSILGKITSKVSQIPSLIHDSISSWKSMNSDPFEDQQFPAMQMPQKPKEINSPRDETLEYFRKRPHLFDKSKALKGFRPIAAPSYIASEYYKMTSTSSPLSSFDHYPSTQKPKIKKSRHRGSTSSNIKIVYSKPTKPPVYSSNPSWNEIVSRHSLDDLKTARDRIFKLLSEDRVSYADDNQGAESQVSDFTFATPPTTSHFSYSPGYSVSTAAKSNSAFDDLMKLFKFSMKTETKDMTDDELKGRTKDDWKPMTKGGFDMNPMLHFKAGITFARPKSSSTKSRPSFFTSSPSPFSKETSYYSTLSPKQSSYASSYSPYTTARPSSFISSSSTFAPSFSLSSTTASPISEIEYFNIAGASSTKAPHHYHFGSSTTARPNAISSHYSKPGSSPLGSSPYASQNPEYKNNNYYKPTENVKISSDPNLNTRPSVQYFSGKNLFEIIPSSEMNKYKIQQDEIAAIIKPTGMTYEQVRLQLPKGIRYDNLQIIDESILHQNPDVLTKVVANSPNLNIRTPSPTFKTPSHLFQSTSASPFGSYAQYPAAPAALNLGASPQFINTNADLQASAIQQLFTNYQLPGGLDPELAAMIRAELEAQQVEIPEEFRKDFQQDQKVKQETYASPKLDYFPVPLSPGEKSFYSPQQQRRTASEEVKSVFHKPVALKPNIKLPKYVIDLARKLKSDKDVQGIIRVSRIVNGVPKEFLYPVRG